MSELKELLQDFGPLAEYVEKNCRQRAALLALIKILLIEEKEDLTIHNVKILICNFFSRLIDEDNMVRDETEKDVMEAVIDFAKQEELLEQFQ
jgi:hypothetical protein